MLSVELSDVCPVQVEQGVYCKIFPFPHIQDMKVLNATSAVTK